MVWDNSHRFQHIVTKNIVIHPRSLQWFKIPIKSISPLWHLSLFFERFLQKLQCYRCRSPGRLVSKAAMSIIMHDRNFSLSFSVLEPLDLNPDAASSGRPKATPLFHNKRKQIFNCRLTDCTYLGRCEVWTQSEDAIKDISGYIWSRSGIPEPTLITENQEERCSALLPVIFIYCPPNNNL